MIYNLSSLRNGVINRWSSESATFLLSSSCMSLKTIGAPSRQLLAAIMASSACTHVFSGTEGAASVPLGSVHSMAYFLSVPVGTGSDIIQTVAVSLTAGGFGFPGTLKSTIAEHNFGSMEASTVQLSEAFNAWMLMLKNTHYKLYEKSVKKFSRICIFLFETSMKTNAGIEDHTEMLTTSHRLQLDQ